MNDHTYIDKQLRCASCGDGFVFSAGEQELHHIRGIAGEPRHCPVCARAAGLSRLPSSIEH